MTVGKTRKYSATLLKTMRYTGLVSMVLLTCYSMAFYFIDTEGFYRQPLIQNSEIIPILSALYLILGISEYYINPKSERSHFIMLVAYYIAVSSFTLFVSSDPMIASIIWLIILIVTGVLLGYLALAIGSVFVFASVSISWISPTQDFTISYLLPMMVGSLLIVFTAGYITYLRTAGVVRFDVYEQLKSKEKVQRERLETVINSINDAVLNISSTGKIRLYNAATLMLLDTNDNINGKDFDEMFSLSDENGDTIPISRLIKDTRQIIERSDLTHSYSDSQKINVFISISRVRGTFESESIGSNVGGFIVIIRDITKQKSLDDERDEFIAVVSHELRTPVAITEGTLSNLEFALTNGIDSQDMLNDIEKAHKQVLFLSQMVNDLSTLSRAQRGVNMEPEQISIKEFVGELYNKYLSEADQRSLQLNIDVTGSGYINTARMAIEEIMQNLITNALKYTKSGSVTIGARIVKEENSKTLVELFVKDTGIGISKSDQAHVFQRFWRSEDYRTRETSGTGLGLHVVEKLASTIGTRVELKSRLNHGSTFSFRIPIYDREEGS